MPGPDGAWGDGTARGRARRRGRRGGHRPQGASRILRLAAAGRRDRRARPRPAFAVDPDRTARAIAREAAVDGHGAAGATERRAAAGRRPGAIAVIGEGRTRCARTQGGGSATVIPAYTSSRRWTASRARWPGVRTWTGHAVRSSTTGVAELAVWRDDATRDGERRTTACATSTPNGEELVAREPRASSRSSGSAPSHSAAGRTASSSSDATPTAAPSGRPVARRVRRPSVTARSTSTVRRRRRSVAASEQDRHSAPR